MNLVLWSTIQYNKTKQQFYDAEKRRAFIHVGICNLSMFSTFMFVEQLFITRQGSSTTYGEDAVVHDLNVPKRF